MPEKLEERLKRAKVEFTPEELEDLKVLEQVLQSDPRFEEFRKQKRARAH